MTDTMTTGIDFSQGSASALLDDYLRQLGMYSPQFSQAALTQWKNLAGSQDRGGEFMLWLRGTPEYQARFPYAADLRKRGVPFTEAGAINYERNVRQLFHMVGTPDGFLTQDYINKLIANDVSYNQLEQRIAGNYQEYLAAPQVVKDEFRKQLGDDSAVLAFYLDPEHTVQQFNEIKAKALTRGFGKQFGVDLGDTAAQYAYGQSADQVQSEVARVGQLGGLQRGTIDQAAATQDDLARAAFLGDTAAVNRQLEQRDAEFGDAGGFAGSAGRTGIGAARGA